MWLELQFWLLLHESLEAIGGSTTDFKRVQLLLSRWRSRRSPWMVSSQTTSFKLFLPRGRRRLTQLLLLPIALRTRLN